MDRWRVFWWDYKVITAIIGGRKYIGNRIELQPVFKDTEWGDQFTEIVSAGDESVEAAVTM